jgi:NAD(P)H dehydrogenase (quinone)
MSKVLILYYSTYGHVEKMAAAVATGARETGATVDIKRVPRLLPSSQLIRNVAGHSKSR